MDMAFLENLGPQQITLYSLGIGCILILFAMGIQFFKDLYELVTSPLLFFEGQATTQNALGGFFALMLSFILPFLVASTFAQEYRHPDMSDMEPPVVYVQEFEDAFGVSAIHNHFAMNGTPAIGGPLASLFDNLADKDFRMTMGWYIALPLILSILTWLMIVPNQWVSALLNGNGNLQTATAAVGWSGMFAWLWVLGLLLMKSGNEIIGMILAIVFGLYHLFLYVAAWARSNRLGFPQGLVLGLLNGVFGLVAVGAIIFALNWVIEYASNA